MNKLGSENKNYASCTITSSIEYPVAQKGTDKGVSLHTTQDQQSEVFSSAFIHNQKVLNNY